MRLDVMSADGMANDTDLRRLMDAIAAAETPDVLASLSAAPALARASLMEGASRSSATANYLRTIDHYVYAGDTALHVAAAAHQPEIVRKLIALGAEVGAKNRRGATPLHYAADGVPGSIQWDPSSQASAIRHLIDSGADPDAGDNNGVTPLHRAVRTRCSAAVNALLDGGADPRKPNNNGTTSFMLATRPTGRGGSGSPEAKDEQAKIIRMFVTRGMA
jgi:hypothetical protein